MPGPGIESFRQRGLSAWRAAERALDRLAGAAANPLRHLGAVGMLAFWLVTASGVVLYIFFETSVGEAYPSVARMARWPFAAGALLRGLHRYGTDLLVLATALHLLREWLHGHERGFRRFSWLTGTGLIAFVFVAGIGGYWLPWDRLAQYSATATAEWLDALPLVFPTPFARNFLAAVDDRLFSLFIFVHVGVSLLMLFALWFHVQRISRPAAWPARAVAWPMCAVLVVVSLALPVQSAPPAALATVPATLPFDWIVLFVHPLVDATSPGVVWAAVGAATVVLFGLPFMPTQRRAARSPVAVVDAGNCNGCKRCLADCPYEAVRMVPHPNQRIGRTLAVVDADLCAGCGICAGACPSSTPFRSAATLVTGIDMPQLAVGALRQRLQGALAACSAPRPLVVFGCEQGARAATLAGDDVCSFELLCAGQLPPSFVEYALRDGAAGVLVAACGEGGCEFRLGERWTRERLKGLREPHLRASVEARRIELAFAGAGDERSLAGALQQLRQRVQALPRPVPEGAPTLTGPVPVPERVQALPPPVAALPPGRQHHA
ncbi:MAG: hydrogenase iron-sulfur subunit [Rubrivivax sp.]|nr:hydrogenase iron-sulfur subunit [Rubrivivax sp.]